MSAVAKRGKMVPFVLITTPAHSKKSAHRPAVSSPLKSMTGLPSRFSISSPLKPPRRMSLSELMHGPLTPLSDDLSSPCRSSPSRYKKVLSEAELKDSGIREKCNEERTEEWDRVQEANVFDAEQAGEVQSKWNAQILEQCKEVTLEEVDVVEARIVVRHKCVKWYRDMRKNVLSHLLSITEYGPHYDACRKDRLADESAYRAAQFVDEKRAALIQKTLANEVKKLARKNKGPDPPSHATESKLRVLARKLYLSQYEAARKKALIAYKKVVADSEAEQMDEETDEDFVPDNDHADTEQSEQDDNYQQVDENLEQDEIDRKADEDLLEQAADVNPRLAHFLSMQLEDRMFNGAQVLLGKKLSPSFNSRRTMYEEMRASYDDLRVVAREFWSEMVYSEDWLLEYDEDERASNTCIGNTDEVIEAIEELGNFYRSQAVKYYGQEISPTDFPLDYNWDLGLWAKLEDKAQYESSRREFHSKIKNLSSDTALEQEYKRIKSILHHRIHVDAMFPKAAKVDKMAAKAISARQRLDCIPPKPDKWNERIQWLWLKLEILSYSDLQHEAIVDGQALPETPAGLKDFFHPMGNYLIEWQEQMKNKALIIGRNSSECLENQKQDLPKSPLVSYESSPARGSPMKDGQENTIDNSRDQAGKGLCASKSPVKRPLAKDFAMDDEVSDVGSDEEEEEEEDEEEDEDDQEGEEDEHEEGNENQAGRLDKAVKMELMAAEAEYKRSVESIAKKHVKDLQACFSFLEDEGVPKATRGINIWNAFKSYYSYGDHTMDKLENGVLF